MRLLETMEEFKRNLKSGQGRELGFKFSKERSEPESLSSSSKPQASQLKSEHVHVDPTPVISTTSEPVKAEAIPETISAQPPIADYSGAYMQEMQKVKKSDPVTSQYDISEAMRKILEVGFSVGQMTSASIDSADDLKELSDELMTSVYTVQNFNNQYYTLQRKLDQSREMLKEIHFSVLGSYPEGDDQYYCCEWYIGCEYKYDDQGNWIDPCLGYVRVTTDVFGNPYYPMPIDEYPVEVYEEEVYMDETSVEYVEKEPVPVSAPEEKRPTATKSTP